MHHLDRSCVVVGNFLKYCVPQQASRHAAFLAALDRTHGKEAMASRRAEFITAGGHTVTWADFEAAMAEWAMGLEVAKAAQEDRKR